jgi:hypothetical protein
MQAQFNPNESDFNCLHKIAEGLYSFVTHFYFDGKAPLQNRSIMVHRPSKSGKGELLVINPAELSSSIQGELQALELSLNAKVVGLISPGDWHYMFIDDYLKHFPGSIAYVCPGRVPTKSPGFPFTLVDVDSLHSLKTWCPELEIIAVQGLRDFSSPLPDEPRHELVFFHPSSRTIIAGDLLWYARGELEPHQRAMGMQTNVLDFHFAKWKMVRDRQLLQNSLSEIMKWDFVHFISVHGGPGNMLLNTAKDQMQAVVDWVRAGS